jgi:predicted dehydrogenase
MPPPSRVRIAIIGQCYIHAVLAVPSAFLACVVDPHPPTAWAAFAYRCPFFTSIEEMLQYPGMHVDAAIVCTPSHTHVEFSKLLLQAGIHVLCENPIMEEPICTDVSGGLELVC